MLTIGLFWCKKFSYSTIPRAMRKKYATGRPDQKDLNENLAATQGLAHMITECNRLFEVGGHCSHDSHFILCWLSILPDAFVCPLDSS